MDTYTARIDRMKQVALNDMAQRAYARPNPVIVNRIRRTIKSVVIGSALVVGLHSYPVLSGMVF